MAKNKKPQVSVKIEEEIEQRQTKKYTFSFNQFEIESLPKNEIKDFNNCYKDNEHFIEVNKHLFEVIKILSNETYKETVINNKLVKTRHFKVLDRQDSRERVNQILKSYGKSASVIRQWEDSQYIEFGMTNVERFIGVILDYNIIVLLYFDPNHLTFPNYSFDLSKSLNYTVKAFNSREATYTLDYTKEEKYKEITCEEKIELYDSTISAYINGESTAEETLEYLKMIYKGE